MGFKIKKWKPTKIIPTTLLDPMFCRMFAKEEDEISAYAGRMDNVIDKSVKEALIQVGLNPHSWEIFESFSLSFYWV